ncbi:MAG: SAM-dependent methyltransferase [Treponema sp.]|jgi:SAM-dependent methyltransferase|nr:SAM-dependent methyltransferase [Treponema sp.]
MYTPVFKELSGRGFGEIVKIVFSGSSGAVRRITVRPLRLKGGDFWQCEKIVDDKAFHQNIEAEKLQTVLGGILNSNGFSDINIFLADKHISYHTASNGRLNRKESARKENRTVELSHDRKKSYILPEGTEIPPLVDLGVFDSSYRVVKSKYGKFVQINRFIEIIAEKLKHFSGNELRVVDFGCGKSYLTFIVYYYFTFIRNINTRIAGYDVKKEVIRDCRGIAERYGYSGIEFFEADISRGFSCPQAADMMISLHACDTATDYALWHAIQNNVRFVFSVPCCQQEINRQIKFRDEYSLLGQYGLYKERFSAILTDTIRCEVLRSCGYDVDVVEFTDSSATPKNAMIRAELKHPPPGANMGVNAALADINRVARYFNVSQTLLNLINGAAAEGQADGLLADEHTSG